MIQPPTDPQPANSGDTPSGPPAPAPRRTGRSPWLLLSGLAALCLAVTSLNTLVLPEAAPDLRWGPMRPAQGRAVRTQPPNATTRLASPQQRQQDRLRADPGLDAPAGAGASDRVRIELGNPVGGGSWQQVLARRLTFSGQGTTFLTPVGVHHPGPQGIGLYVASLSSLAALSALFAFLTPTRVRVMRGAIQVEPSTLLRLAAIGAVAYGLFALLGVFLSVLVVGIPLATLLLFAAVPATAFGLSAVALALGRLIVRTTRTRQVSPLLDLAAGILVLFTASILPFVGWLAFGAAAALGMGALIVTRMGTGDPWSLTALES